MSTGPSRPSGEGGDQSALGLEDLEGAGDVEEALAAGADDGHARAAQLRQVGRDVHRGLARPRWTPPRPPVPKDADAGQPGQEHGTGDGRAAVDLLSCEALNEAEGKSPIVMKAVVAVYLPRQAPY